jgi:hypothetical protein
MSVIKFKTASSCPIEIQLSKHRYYDVIFNKTFSESQTIDTTLVTFPGVDTSLNISDGSLPILHVDDQELPNRNKLTYLGCLAPHNRYITTFVPYKSYDFIYNVDWCDELRVDENLVVSGFHDWACIDTGVQLKGNSFTIIQKVRWEGGYEESNLWFSQQDRPIGFTDGRLGVWHEGWHCGETNFSDTEGLGEGIYWIKLELNVVTEGTLTKFYWIKDDNQELTLENAITSEDWNLEYEYLLDINPFGASTVFISRQGWQYWRGDIYLADGCILDENGDICWKHNGSMRTVNGVLDIDVYDVENETTYNMLYNYKSNRLRLDPINERKKDYAWIGTITIPDHTTVELPEYEFYKIIGNPTVTSGQIEYPKWTFSGECSHEYDDYYRLYHFGRITLNNSNFADIDNLTSAKAIFKFYSRSLGENVEYLNNGQISIFSTNDMTMVHNLETGDITATGSSYGLNPDGFNWLVIDYDGTDTNIYITEDNEYTLDTLPDLSSFDHISTLSGNMMGNANYKLGYTGLHQEHSAEQGWFLNSIQFTVNDQPYWTTFAITDIAIEGFQRGTNEIYLNDIDWEFFSKNHCLQIRVTTGDHLSDYSEYCAILGSDFDQQGLRLYINDGHFSALVPSNNGWYVHVNQNDSIESHCNYDIIFMKTNNAFYLAQKVVDSIDIDDITEELSRCTEDSKIENILSTNGFRYEIYWKHEQDDYNPVCTAIKVGTSHGDSYNFNGKIWAKHFKVYADGELVYQPFANLTAN